MQPKTMNYNGEPYDWTHHGHQVPTPAMLAQMAKWDHRFIEMAEMVASWSKDPSTKCGAIIVRPDRSVASVGFNGFPRGVEDRQEHLDEREEKYGRVIHAEVNAILAAREPLHGYTMYTFPGGVGPSCDRCATCVIQAGITRIVHVFVQPERDDFNDRWKIAANRGLDMYRMAGVEVVHLPNYLPE